VVVDSPRSGPTRRLLWLLARLPILLVLVMLEPVISFMLTALALLGLLTTLFFYLVGPPEFSVWTMFALSLSFAIALVLYHALIRLLSDV
jgi:hypothetical protein